MTGRSSWKLREGSNDLPTPSFYERMSAINMHDHSGFLQGGTIDVMKTEAFLLREQEFLQRHIKTLKLHGLC